MPVKDNIGTIMGKLGLDTTLKDLEKKLAEIEAPPERPAQYLDDADIPDSSASAKACGND